MHKFKKISELKERQQQLKKRRQELEMLIGYQWKDMKNNLVSDVIEEGKAALMSKVPEFIKNIFKKKDR